MNGPSGLRDNQERLSRAFGRTIAQRVAINKFWWNAHLVVKQCQEVEALRSTNKNHAGNEKHRGTKKKTTKRGCENTQGRRDGCAEPATPRSRARMRGKRHMTSRCAAISGTNPPDHPELETPNVFERDEQERAKGRQKDSKKRVPRTKRSWSR